jgi:putative nucleotidyltransferase with HDIG domain
MVEAIAEFKSYTNNYLEYGEMIKLKTDHTLRVVDLCERLAKSLNLTEEEIYVSKIIGLLHDIGRFEQWKNYDTFNDAKSIDHADFAVEILKKDNYIRKYIEDNKYDEIILKSIEYHNKYEIPNNLDEKTLTFAKLIRDADKIDILYLFVKGELKRDLEDIEFNENIYKTLLNRKCINRKDLKTLTDRLAVPLGFIFDINYKESFNILNETKYIDKIINIYKEKTNNEKLKEQLEEIRKEINEYIEVNLC